jgi:hypothetical protein
MITFVEICIETYSMMAMWIKESKLISNLEIKKKLC